MRKNIAAFIILILCNFHANADIVTTPGSGEVFTTRLSGTMNVVVSGQGNWLCDQAYTMGILGGLTEISQNDYGTTTDGVYGVKYSPWPESDTVLTLKGSTTTNRVQGASGTGIVSNLTINWINGKPQSLPAVYNNCYGSYPWLVTPEYTGGSNRGNGTVSVNLTLSVHVGPNAVRGNTYTPRNSTVKTYVRDGQNEITSATLPNVMIPGSPSCAISAPGVIDFGQVDVTKAEGQGSFILGVQKGDFIVNCSSPLATTTAAATVRVSTLNYTNNNLLDIFIGSNRVVANVSGFIGPGIPGNGTCNQAEINASPATIWYKGANIDKPIGDLKVGQNKIPYLFTLCSNNRTAESRGKGTGKATLNLFWD